MPRFRLVIEYAGTRYSGWQVQTNARTIAGELGRVIAEVTGSSKFELYGSGRTDAGVHALQQVAHLDVATRLPPAALQMRFNDLLPHDIVVAEVRVVSHRFHARRDAVRRSYLYQMVTRPIAFGKPMVWWVKEPLNVPAMQEAARAFEGRHDFRSFTDADRDEVSTEVVVEAVLVRESPPFVLVRVVGSHFLWKMVRRMVGVLAEVGKGGLDARDVGRFLHADSPVPARLTAPASGLFLERVFYPGEETTERPLTPVLML